MVALLLSTHMGLLACSVRQHSPTDMEMAHLAAGISHWRFGDCRLLCVNPPLVRALAALPVLLMEPKTDWGRVSPFPERRPEFDVAQDFVLANGQRSVELLAAARWACLPLSIIGASVVFFWARELYGRAAGVLALGLWCFSPTMMAHAQLITPDAGAAALGVAAAYVFRRWLKQPGWGRACWAGVVLGLAQLTKTTWIVLFGLWPLLWIAWNCTGPKSKRAGPTGDQKAEGENREVERGCVRQAGQMAIILFLGLYVLNLGYVFEGSFQELGDYRFVSEMLAGPNDESQRPDPSPGRNRFQGTLLARLPVPLPKHYLLGIDLQEWDFERRLWSFLRGEWRKGGWWYYYLYALAIKVPLGTWILVLLALLVGLFGQGYSASRRDELLLLAPLAVVLILVSSQTGFAHHMRYVLPSFPFAFIWVSKVARAVDLEHAKIALLAAAATAWSVGSSLYIYPHSLSYFNELVGGPTGGHAHLLGSNIDWGQDLLYLKRWLKKHPDVRLDGLVSHNRYRPACLGLDCPMPPKDPRPGWYAVSVNNLRSRSRAYEYFLNFTPVAMAGYSIYVYHITSGEANRARRELGLPELAAREGR